MEQNVCFSWNICSTNHTTEMSVLFARERMRYSQEYTLPANHLPFHKLSFQYMFVLSGGQTSQVCVHKYIQTIIGATQGPYSQTFPLLFTFPKTDIFQMYHEQSYGLLIIEEKREKHLQSLLFDIIQKINKIKQIIAKSWDNVDPVDQLIYTKLMDQFCRATMTLSHLC